MRKKRIKYLSICILTISITETMNRPFKALADGLVPLPEQTCIMASAFQDEISPGGMKSMLEEKKEDYPFQITLEYHSLMKVPEAGIEEPMEVVLTEKLNGWYHDQVNFALEGTRKVEVNDESMMRNERFYGTGETCYRAYGDDWCENKDSDFLTFLFNVEENTEVTEKDCQRIIDWILEDTDSDIQVKTDGFEIKQEDAETVRISLKEDALSDLCYQKEYGFYETSFLEIHVWKDLHQDVPMHLSEEENEILQDGFYDTMIRQSLRDFNTGRDAYYRASDGSPYILTYLDRYLVSIKCWEGTEFDETVSHLYRAGLKEQNKSYQIKWGYKNIAEELEKTKIDMLKYDYILYAEGTVLHEEQEIPYLVMKSPYSEKITIYSGISVDNETKILIEIEQELQDEHWDVSECEESLHKLVDHIHVTEGIKRDKYLLP